MVWHFKLLHNSKNTEMFTVIDNELWDFNENYIKHSVTEMYFQGMFKESFPLR